MLKKLTLLAAVFSLFCFGCMPKGSFKKMVPHPGLESAPSTGYIELWAPTPFGMWLKDLEEGPSACGVYRVWKSGMEKGHYLAITKVLEWPGSLGNIKYRPIADNFSAARFAMPPGKHDLYIAAGLECYPDDEAEKFNKKGFGGPGYVGISYNVPVFAMELEVEPNAIKLYRVALRQRDSGEFFIHQHWTDTLLPVPENPKKLDPDPNSYNALVKMLEDEDWGFRWYAAKRLRFIGNKSTVPIVQERLKVEEHKDVRNELEKAVEKLGK